jgi:fructose-1,6-bisphosphatase II / sedoheptulose-1,7-bisphosphatase
MVTASSTLDRVLVLEMVRVTEAAAVAASKLIGRGDEKAADHAAVEAMRAALNTLEMDGTVVIGEGERDEAPMLYIGEKVGSAQGTGPRIDIALDPLEGTTITAKAGPNALAVLAIAEEGGLLNAPDVYMEKLAVGPGYAEGIIDLSKSPTENVRAVAAAKGVDPSDIIVCVLDRPRHAELIAELRALGCGINLIPDGDVAGVIAVTDPDTTIDMYMGSGGAPEGVLAAAALRCVGGQFQGKLLFRNDDERARAAKWGVEDLDRIYHLNDLAEGRLHLRGDRGDGRIAARRRQAAQERHQHRKRGHARLHRHRPLGEGRAPSRAGFARLGRAKASRCRRPAAARSN